MKVPMVKKYNPKSEYQATYGLNRTQKNPLKRLSYNPQQDFDSPMAYK